MDMFQSQPQMSLEHMVYLSAHIRSIYGTDSQKNIIPLSMENFTAGTSVYTFKVELRIVTAMLIIQVKITFSLIVWVLQTT